MISEKQLFDNIKTLKNYASHDLGQNFLSNPNIARTIVSMLEIEKDDDVLEIGAGFGALSYYVVNSDAKSVTLDDVDLRSITFLEENLKKDNVEIIKKSALKISLDIYTKIIGNLPYYLTSDLLEKTFVKSIKCKKFVYMVQKEVFDKLRAKTSEDGYGPLSIFIKTIGDITDFLHVRRNEFIPAPHVDSTVFVITKERYLDEKVATSYMYYLKKMFIHRRKTIMNNLSQYLKNKIEAATYLKKAEISPNTRPEDISPTQYINLFEILSGISINCL